MRESGALVVKRLSQVVHRLTIDHVLFHQIGYIGQRNTCVPNTFWVHDDRSTFGRTRAQASTAGNIDVSRQAPAFTFFTKGGQDIFRLVRAAAWLGRQRLTTMCADEEMTFGDVQ
ncbi:MAG: hypothetical protein ACI8TX_001534 [Hyphomicrobiaceae bacterium]|jgi:hypothetical protein